MRSLPVRCAAAACVVLAIGGVAACGRGDTAASSAEEGSATAPPTLAEVALPDLTRLDASVQQQARERHAQLEKARTDPRTPPEELGRAYGEFGMLMHGTEFYDVAEPAYRNAEILQPREKRWPYYLAHVYRTEGESAKAIEAFGRALTLGPNDLPTLVWLGRMHLEQGEPEQAESFFTKAAAIPPKAIAPLAGLGQAALARRDYTRAAQFLEEALAIDPRVHSLHSPLALAYRGLGDVARAEQHTKQWRNTELPLADPLLEAVNVSVNSGLSYELQGVKALEEREFTRAADLFRKGAALAPATTSLGRSLRHKLGTALALSGDVPAAIEQFEEVARLAPVDALDEPSAKAHYSLGVLHASGGSLPQAIRHLASAVKYNPNYVEARLALGDALRRSGQVGSSLEHYAEAVRLSPLNASARFGYAIGLVRLRRYVEARDWLAESVRVQPDDPELTHALARLLAASPDPAARDGQRAAALVNQLFATHKTIDVGETMAMAMAELGQFEDAVMIQRDLIGVAQKAGTPAAHLRRLTANLRLYEQRQPCRTPWSDDDPVHFPGPQAGAA